MNDMNDVVAPQSRESLTQELSSPRLSERCRGLIQTALAEGEDSPAWEEAECCICDELA